MKSLNQGEYLSGTVRFALKVPCGNSQTERPGSETQISSAPGLLSLLGWLNKWLEVTFCWRKLGPHRRA